MRRKRSRSEQRQIDALLLEASSAAREILNLKTELDAALENLPRNAAKSLTTHLRAISHRLGDAGTALQRELDQVDPDPKTVRHYAAVGGRGAELLTTGFVAGSLLGGLMQGIGQESVNQIFDRSKQVEGHCLVIEQTFFGLPSTARDLEEQMRDEAKEELQEEMRDEVREELQEEMRPEVEEDLKREIKAEEEHAERQIEDQQLERRRN